MRLPYRASPCRVRAGADPLALPALDQERPTNFYRRFPGDYASKTKSLTLLQHGAYALLLDYIYSTEKPLPSDWPSLYRICSATSFREKNAVEYVTCHYFVLGDLGWSNKRVLEEIENAKNRANSARNNGLLGGRPKNNERTSEKLNGTHSVSRGFELANPQESSPDSRLQTKPKTPLPPIAKPAMGDEQFFEWAGQTVAVSMGRKRRLPNLSAYEGGRASDVVEFLARRGFAARIVSVQ